MCKSNYKFAIIIVNDGEVLPGKAAALATDATIKLMSNSTETTSAETNWLKEGPNNIILEASRHDILEIMTRSLSNNIKVLPVTEDEFKGFSLNNNNVDVIKTPVVKALALGPDKSHKMNKIIGNLKLYNY